MGSTLLRGAGRKRRTVDAARRGLDACRRAGRSAVSTGAGNRADEEKIALPRATTMPSVFAVCFRLRMSSCVFSPRKFTVVVLCKRRGRTKSERGRAGGFLETTFDDERTRFAAADT